MASKCFICNKNQLWMHRKTLILRVHGNMTQLHVSVHRSVLTAAESRQMWPNRQQLYDDNNNNPQEPRFHDSFRAKRWRYFKMSIKLEDKVTVSAKCCYVTSSLHLLWWWILQEQRRQMSKNRFNFARLISVSATTQAKMTFTRKDGDLEQIGAYRRIWGVSGRSGSTVYSGL